MLTYILFFVKMGKHGFEYIYSHLLSPVALGIYYLPELLEDIIIVHADRIFQQIVYTDTEPVDKPDQSIEGKASFPSFYLTHVGIGYIYIFG